MIIFFGRIGPAERRKASRASRNQSTPRRAPGPDRSMPTATSTTWVSFCLAAPARPYCTHSTYNDISSVKVHGRASLAGGPRSTHRTPRARIRATDGCIASTTCSCAASGAGRKVHGVRAYRGSQRRLPERCQAACAGAGRRSFPPKVHGRRSVNKTDHVFDGPSGRWSLHIGVCGPDSHCGPLNGSVRFPAGRRPSGLRWPSARVAGPS
jgi:hypothetical protein